MAVLGFHQNRVAGFPRRMRKSLPPPAVKFGPANRDSSPFGPDVIEDECGDEESEKYSNDAIADVVEIGVGRLPLKDAVEECECDLQTGITDSLATGRNPARDGRGTSDKGDERCDRFHVWHEEYDGGKRERSADHATDAVRERSGVTKREMKSARYLYVYPGFLYSFSDLLTILGL